MHINQLIYTQKCEMLACKVISSTWQFATIWQLLAHTANYWSIMHTYPRWGR